MTTILAVDDSASLRGTIVFALTERGGFEVVEAEDGQHGLNVIQQRRDQQISPFDLILADINMPVMDGFEMVAKIRMLPDYRFTPILFLTTENTESAKQKGRDLNATGWVTKPFSPENLLSVVHRVLPK